jgi:biopolymer transport protein ExbB/TolQ
MTSIPDKQLVEFLSELKALEQAKKHDKGYLMDTLMKVSVAICTAGILWLIASVATLNTKFATMEVTQSLSQQSLDKRLEGLEGKANSPQFTMDTFSQKIAPYTQIQQNHTEILNETKIGINSLENRLTKTENSTQRNGEKLSEISESLKEIKNLIGAKFK